MRDHIIHEIRRLAGQNDGQAPGETLFAKKTGIAKHQWRGKHWVRWSDAVAEAGFAPSKWNERHDTDAVLASYVMLCRHYGRLPITAEIDFYRRSHPSAPSRQTIRRHFGGSAGLLAALRSFVRDKAECSDIATMLPPESSSTVEPPRGRLPPEGFVYLIQSGEFYKIGRSDDLERRVKEIRVALPDKATLVHSIRTDDPPGIEAYWHTRFRERRANGEWFKLSALDVSAFRRRKYQ